MLHFPFRQTCYVTLLCTYLSASDAAYRTSRLRCSPLNECWPNEDQTMFNCPFIGSWQEKIKYARAGTPAEYIWAFPFILRATCMWYQDAIKSKTVTGLYYLHCPGNCGWLCCIHHLHGTSCSMLDTRLVEDRKWYGRTVVSVQWKCYILK